MMLKSVAFVLATLMPLAATAKVKSVKIQNLSTMGSDIFPSRVKNLDTYTHGEWGHAALIEIERDNGDIKQILFDTGAYKETVLGNVRKLEVDFRPDVAILSHFHLDHTGGLSTLKKAFPNTLKTVHVGDLILAPRKEVDANGNLGKEEVNTFIAESQQYLKLGGRLVSHDRSEVLKEIDEDVMLVYRPSSALFNDTNTQGNPYRYLGKDGQYHEDDLPEELSLVINTKDGLIVISGCAHRGILNTVDSVIEDARAASGGRYSEKIFALAGGYHLLFSDKRKLTFEGAPVPYNQVIATMLQRWKVKLFWGAHCTGHQATESILQTMKNDKKAKLSDGFQPDDALKVLEGRAGQTFTYDGTAIPKVNAGVYR